MKVSGERYGKPFEIRVEPRGKSALVRLAGEFDLSSKKEFVTRLSEVTSTRPEEVILDLRDVAFIDSTGLRLVLEAWNQSQRGGFDFAVLRGEGQVRRLLQETGLDRALPIVEDLPASEHLGAGPGSGNGSA